MSEIADFVTVITGGSTLAFAALFLVAAGLFVFDRTPRASQSVFTARPLTVTAPPTHAASPTEAEERKAA